MDFVFTIIGYLSIPLLILSVLMMIRSLKRERAITIQSLLLQIAISIVLLLVYTRLIGIAPLTVISWALMGGGLIFGALQGGGTKMRRNRYQVLGKRSVLFLVIWGASFTITQLMVLLAPSNAASYGLLTIYFATGLSIGVNITLLAKRQITLLRSSDSTSCPSCGKEIGANAAFCTACGKVITPAAINTPQSVSCTVCGKNNSVTQRFCTACGNAVKEKD